jgi:hypothetical protein
MDETLKPAAHVRVRDELMVEGINVAVPVDTCDIDVLAFIESRTDPCALVSVPIQIVVVHGDGLSETLGAARASGMLVALICDVGESACHTPAETPNGKSLRRLEKVRTTLGITEESYRHLRYGNRGEADSYDSC